MWKILAKTRKLSSYSTQRWGKELWAHILKQLQFVKRRSYMCVCLKSSFPVLYFYSSYNCRQWKLLFDPGTYGMYHFFKNQTHARKRLWGPHLGISREWFQKEVRSLQWTKWVFQSKDNELVLNVDFSHPFGIGRESTLRGVHCSILAPGERRKARRKLDQQDSAGNCAEKWDMKQLSPQLYSSHCLFKHKRWSLRSFLSFFL